MNKLFINILNVIILFFCLLNSIDNCFVNSSITLKYSWGGDDSLVNYPLNSNGQTCSIKMAFHFITTDTNPIQVTAKDAVISINQINSISKQQSVFELIKNSQTTGIIESNYFTLTDSFGSTTFSSRSTCKTVQLSTSVIETVKSGIFAGQYYVIFRYRNIGVWDYQLIDGGSSISFSTSKSLGNNFFLIPFSTPLFKSNIQVKIDVGLSTSNPIFNVEYPYSLEATSNITQELYYPNNENLLFTGIGVGIITIESNKESLFIGIEGSKFSAFKIGGSINIGIYMLHFSNLPQISTYKIKIQNGSNLIEIQKSFKQSIITNPYQINVTPLSIGNNLNVLTTTNTIQNINVGQSMKSLFSRNNDIKLFELGFPFGYIGGTSVDCNFSISVITDNSEINYQFGNDIIKPPVTYKTSDTEPPLLLNYNLNLIDGGKRLLYQLKISDPISGVKSFETVSEIYLIGKYLVSGDQFNGVVEIDMEYHDTTFIRLCDYNGNCNIFNLDSYIFNNDVQPALVVLTTSPKKLLSIPNTFKYLDDITNISFKVNNLNVTGKSTYNVMTIKLTNFPSDRTLLVRFYPSNDNPYVIDNTPVYYARYNSDPTILAYQCEFIVPANIGIGQLQYSITLDMTGPKVIYSDSLGPGYQLMVVESQEYDFIGPIVTASTPIKEITTDQVTIGWVLTIEDSVNGYMGNGYILIRASIDMTIRNLTVTTPSIGNNYKGDYRFSFSIPKVCTSQTYSIVYAKFIDSQGCVTEFDESVEMGTLMNPFYPLLNEINFKNYYHECDSSLLSVNGPTTKPTLNEFIIPTVVNVFGTENERTLNFEFTVSHPDGIIPNPYPSVYLTSIDQVTIYSNQDQVNPTIINPTTVKYTITMEIPYGFGYSKGILISFYGVVSNAGIHSGFSSQTLTGIPIDTSTLTVNSGNLILTGNSQLSSNGGNLWLYGNQLNQVNQLEVQYPNDTIITLPVTPTSLTNSSFSVVFPASEETVRVRAKKPTNIFSNQIKIQPFIYKDLILPINPPPTPTLTSTITPTPTLTTTTTPSPTPTNIPCKSTCGISNNQGYCSIQGYCICNSPYIGSDCSSTIITIPPPKTNEIQPSTEIKIPNVEIKYSSIVSIVSIRELDFKFDQVHSYTFEKWVFNSILDNETKTKYSYFSNITDSNNNVISNITAILEWNSIETIVEFAGQPIVLLPSSIKYTIEISKYPFSSALNSLQLIMSTSIIKSSDNDDCLTGKSNLVYGNSSSSTIENQNNSDSNYVELKVDNYLFYGRFIKRALIDEKPIPVTNTKLSNDNIEVKIGSSSSKIGINIPWYQSNAIIDPDFSLLIQSNLDNGGNDDCLDNGLTTAQLVGIIIGSIAFFVILVIITFAIIYRLPRCFKLKIFLYKSFRKSKL